MTNDELRKKFDAIQECFEILSNSLFHLINAVEALSNDVYKKDKTHEPETRTNTSNQFN